MNEEFTEDPKRWMDGGAPEGALALLATLDEPPPLPPLVRKRVGHAVRSATRSTPRVPWLPLLLAAAVALLAFAAGWLWAGSETAPDRPTVAAPPETLEPEAAEPSSAMALPAASMEPIGDEQETVEREELAPPPRRHVSMESAMRPDLLDPFAGRRPPTRPPGMAIDPFADRPPVRAEPGELHDPFASRGSSPDEPARQQQQRNETGVLVINTIPWSRVFLDGQDTGQNTPIRNLRVTPGRHRIGMRTQDGTMHTISITVQAGETVRIVRRL